jgi:hypothetical protein
MLIIDHSDISKNWILDTTGNVDIILFLVDKIPVRRNWTPHSILIYTW